ncbi:amidohydrolase family protein [Christensenella intestinihominis]|uniref:amidohydrolase family protein n=1 Tax=Christensenella intestinihominis TaxID=1851429 RepID=UPI00082A1E0B|nr:amidohydrolase family protein [Christensenella intestinihominis]
MISDFEIREDDRKQFAEEFLVRLPARIIDSHVHVWTHACVAIPKEEYGKYKQYKPWTDFDYMKEFTIEDYLFCAKSAFPPKTVIPIVFGSPFPQIDRTMVNEYVMEHAQKYGLGFYYIPGQYEDMEETEKKYNLLGRKGFLGLKPYPDIPVVQGRECGIYDMLNQSALEYAQQNKLFILLHIPRKGRLHDADNRRELDECTRTYPDAKFILAHVGRAFCYKDIDGLIDFLVGRENVWFDTALINSGPVLEYLLHRVDSTRILFGSDAPLAFCRGKDIEINNKHYYVSEHPVPWGLGPMGGSIQEFTFYIYEEIRELLRASKAVYGQNETSHLENIFYKNAGKMLKITN